MEIIFKSPYDIGMMELKRDSVFRKIKPDSYNDLIDFSWERGKSTAMKYMDKLSTSVPSEMITKLNITVAIKMWEIGKSAILFYSEYADKPPTITLYENSIAHGLENAIAHGYKQILSLDAAKEIFLAHELYHHIECRDIGLASKEHKVIMAKLGPFKLTSGIRALCEIGAHSFARFLLETNQHYTHIK